MGRQYSNVEDVARDIVGDEFAEFVRAEGRRRVICKLLSIRRVCAGLSYSEIADRVPGWDAAFVEMLEDGPDEELTVAIISAFLLAIEDAKTPGQVDF